MKKNLKKINYTKLVVWILVIALLVSTFAGVIATVVYNTKYDTNGVITDVVLDENGNVVTLEDGQIIQGENGVYLQAHVENGETHLHEIATNEEELNEYLKSIFSEAETIEEIETEENVEILNEEELVK